MAETESKYAESLISQEDIDRLLREAEIGEGTLQTEMPESDDQITQEEIDRLLGGIGADDDPVGDSWSDGEMADLISQDDIAMLLNSMEESDETDENRSPREDEDLGLVSLKDIEGIINSEFKELVENETGEAAATEAEKSEAMEAGQVVALDEDEGLISQDDIDRLLAERGIPDSEEEGASPAFSSHEIDDLWEENSDYSGETSSDLVAEEEGLITQDDIDKLLREAVVDELAVEEEADHDYEMADLVSQEDIDRLLMGDGGEGDSPLEELPAFEGGDKVILEDGDVSDSPEEKGDAGRKWYKAPPVWITASVFLLMLLSTALFFLLRGEETADLAAIAPADVLKKPFVIEKSSPAYVYPKGGRVNSILKGFIVPAPLTMKGVSYLSADISIEFIDVSSDPLKGYEPFFRNIIYGVLKEALVLEEKSQIVEAGLKKMIQEALNEVLTEGSVGKVDFIAFKVG